ncbi:hypothetical protein FALBO_11004 [Fusarium albosuccineum]|uniref:C2H2-type domain-containing protein n=1 Tax=Fusarium albosuccineum TaxID=1237068 RepID=A0A8H4L6S4_9HYPO|nr:hypothetical protein FALBO_11004 [Fusarium albosuccineum]
MSDSIGNFADSLFQGSLGATDLSLSFFPGTTFGHVQSHSEAPVKWEGNPLPEANNSFSTEYQSTHEPSEEPDPKNAGYSCPYRKRNPAVFNIRDHPTCALRSFPTIPMVKRHIKAAHTLADFDNKCENCGSRFRDEKVFGKHVASKMCTRLPLPQAQNYDWGITRDMEYQLRDRRRRNQVLTWDGIWRTIFPGCNDVPDPYYEPIVEGSEAIESFFKGISELDSSIKTSARWTLCGQGFEQMLRTLYRAVRDQRERKHDTPSFGSGAIGLTQGHQ